MDLHLIFKDMPFNVDKKISKKLLPTLPSCFKKVPFYMGMPRWGMLAQYRCSCMNLHAYDFGEYWEIHKDKNNPFTKPMEHLVEDAPNVLAAVTGTVIVGALGIGYFLTRKPKEKKESQKEKEK